MRSRPEVVFRMEAVLLCKQDLGWFQGRKPFPVAVDNNGGIDHTGLQKVTFRPVWLNRYSKKPKTADT